MKQTRRHVYQPKTKYEYAKHCIRFDIPKTINNSPNSTLDKIHTHSLKCFSGYIKQVFYKHIKKHAQSKIAVSSIDNLSLLNISLKLNCSIHLTIFSK